MLGMGWGIGMGWDIRFLQYAIGFGSLVGADEAEVCMEVGEGGEIGERRGDVVWISCGGFVLVAVRDADRGGCGLGMGHEGWGGEAVVRAVR